MKKANKKGKKKQERLTRAKKGNKNHASILINHIDSVYTALEEDLSQLKSKVTELRKLVLKQRVNDVGNDMTQILIWIQEHGERAQHFIDAMKKIEKQVPQVDCERFPLFKDGYEKMLIEKVGVLKEKAKKARREKFKNLMELLQHLKQESDEGYRTSKAIMASVICSGIRVSSFLVDYFLIVSRSHPERMGAEINEAMAIIGSEKLEESSEIISAFLSVVEFIGTGLKINPEQTAGKMSLKKENKDDLLGVILLAVLNLEVMFSNPTFRMKTPNKMVLLNVGRDIGAFFRFKFDKVLNMRINNLKVCLEVQDTEAAAIKKSLQANIQQIWKKLI